MYTELLDPRKVTLLEECPIWLERCSSHRRRKHFNNAAHRSESVGCIRKRTTGPRKIKEQKEFWKTLCASLGDAACWWGHTWANQAVHLKRYCCHGGEGILDKQAHICTEVSISPLRSRRDILWSNEVVHLKRYWCQESEAIHHPVHRSRTFQTFEEAATPSLILIKTLLARPMSLEFLPFQSRG